MRKHAIILVALALFAMLFAFVACKEEVSQTGTVNVTITDSTSKSPTSYKLTFKDKYGNVMKEATTTSTTWSGTINSGSFTLSVDAILDSANVGFGYATGSVAAEGTKNVEVTASRFVYLTIGETTTAYDTLEAAVAALGDATSATIAVNGEISVASTMELTDKDVTLTNLDGSIAIINDAVTTTATDTGSTSNQVARMFQVSGTSNLIVTGNTSGSILFQGAAEGSAALTACERRVLFFLGEKAASKASGSVTINAGVEVTGIHSSGATSFGTVVRGYGNVNINGGNFHDNYQNGNALFCCYGNTVVNGGTFTNNTSDGSSSILQIAASGATLVVNAGTFSNNTQNYGCIITVAGATTTINDGTFTNNTAKVESGKAGAALHGNNAATVTVNILGGTFSNNKPYDYYRNNSTLTVASTVKLTTN